jgi:3-oxoacyl-[acyl-carrier protein] reductase
MLTLEGKVALVSGGDRGIGRAISVLFAHLGARVLVNYVRNKAAAERTVESIASTGGTAFAHRADVSEDKEAAGLVDAAVSRFGALDTVVVNQGIWKRAPISTMSTEEWDETIRVNLRGAYCLCHHAARVMIPQKSGTLILISSTSGQRGEANYSHYSSTKGALISLTYSLAAELAPHGIRVNGVAPGWVLTDMTRETLAGAGAAEAVAAIPLGRVGTPEEIAGPVAFLASDLASFVYGEILSVNGGAVMSD